MPMYDDNITREYVQIYAIKRKKKSHFKPISCVFDPDLNLSEKKLRNIHRRS